MSMVQEYKPIKPQLVCACVHVFAGRCAYGCMLKSVYLWVLMHCRICVCKTKERSCTQVHVRMCVHDVYVCVCIILNSGDSVEGVCPRAPCTKRLSVLPGGI